MSEQLDYFKANGASAPSFKFEDIGDTIKGTINGTPGVVEVTDKETGEMSRVLVAEMETDDGTYSLWVRRGAMVRAIVAAVQAAGETELRDGGTLAVKYSGNGPKTNPKYSAPKLYEAAYAPPAPAGVSVASLLA